MGLLGLGLGRLVGIKQREKAPVGWILGTCAGRMLIIILVAITAFFSPFPVLSLFFCRGASSSVRV